MKVIIITLALLASINTANSAIITPELNIETPLLITSTTEIFADFGVPGDLIDIDDLFLTLKFDNPSNYFDAGEGLTISLLVDIINPPAGLTSPAWLSFPNTNSSGLAYERTLDLRMLHINDSGIGFIEITTGGGDGMILNSISLTGNANITAVPLPPSLWLFFTGLVSLFLSRTLTRR